MLYRYICLETGIGIFTTFDELHLNIDDYLPLVAIFEDELKVPDDREMMRNTVSWFTAKGNRKFHKAITKICKYLDSKHLHVACIKADKSQIKEIVYEDRYQVIAHTDNE